MQKDPDSSQNLRALTALIALCRHDIPVEWAVHVRAAVRSGQKQKTIAKVLGKALNRRVSKSEIQRLLRFQSIERKRALRRMRKFNEGTKVDP